MRTSMIDEHNLVLFSRSSLNAAILRAEISGSYEEFSGYF